MKGSSSSAALPTVYSFFSLLGCLFVYRFSSDISSLSYLISVQASLSFLSLSLFHIYFVCLFLHKVVSHCNSVFLLYPILLLLTLQTDCSCFPKRMFACMLD